MIPIKDIESRLEYKWQDYEREVYIWAATVFNSDILPYLKKHHFSFEAGNGSYWIGDEHGRTIYRESLPKRIQSRLDMEVPGFDSNNLGSLMPDYGWDKGDLK